MNINIDENDKALIISVAGKLDVKTSPELETVILDQVKNIDKPFVLNFEGLNYISSAGLRVVLIAAKHLKLKKYDLLIAGLKGTVKDVFELSGFYSIFKIFGTVEDAIAALQ